MKKLFVLFMVLGLVFALGLSALAAEEEPEADHVWTYTSQEASVTGKDYTHVDFYCVSEHNCGLTASVTVHKPLAANGYVPVVETNIPENVEEYVSLGSTMYYDKTANKQQAEPFTEYGSYRVWVWVNFGNDYGLFGVDYEITSHVEYMLSQDGTRLSALEYSASNPTGISKGELVLNAPVRSSYGGSGSAKATYTSHFVSPAAFSDARFSYEGINGTVYGPSATAPENAGSYQVSMTVTASDGKDYTLSRSYTIAKAYFDNDFFPVIYDYINETATVDTGTGAAEPVIILRPQQADNMYAPDTGITLENGACISNYTGMRIFYIAVASDNYDVENSYCSFDIPARPAKPSSLAKTDESYDGFNDGKITGVTSRMEYKLQGAESWTAISGTELTGLADGTYLVRYKATDSSFASEAATVTIARGVVPTYTLTASALDFGTLAYRPFPYSAEPLTIISSGNRDATITGVEVSGDFEIHTTGDSVITAGSTNTSWRIRPKTGLTVAGSPYTGTVTITYNNGATATAGLYVSIEKAEAPIYSSAPVRIDYEQETIHVVRNDDAIEPLYAINSQEDGTGEAIPDGGSITDYIGTTIYYKVVESDNYKASTWWRARHIPARPAALSCAVEKETVDGQNDGVILLPDGITGPVEYSADGGLTWTDVLGVKLEGLSDGTYLVRYKATDSSFAGETAEVTVAKGDPPVWDVSISGGMYGTHYNASWVSTFTVTNTGNMPLTNARLSVEGTDAEKMFRIVDKTADLAVGQSGAWAQSYVGQMNVGSYDLTLVVTADNNIRIEKAITFVISPNSQVPPEYHTLQYPWGQDWIAYEKYESSHGAPIQYSFDGGQTWITGTPDPEDPNRLIIRGLTPDTHYSVDFRFGPSPDGNYSPSENYEGSASFGFTTMHEVTMTQGDGQTFYLGSDQDLLFVSSDKFEHFRYLYVYPKGADMSTVAPLEAEHFAAEEGSVRLTLKAEYLNSLPVGEYVVEIPCTTWLGDGEAIASFFVKEMPAGGGSNGGDTEGDIVKTGDSRQAGLWATVAILSAAALTVAIVLKKKKRH